MKVPSKKTLIIGSAILGTVLLIVLVIYFVKKKDVETVVLPKETDWGRDLTDFQSEQIARLAKLLYEDMKGWNAWGHSSQVYEEYAATDDVIFVGVANYFAEKYGKGENLAKWLDDEQFFTLSSTVDAIKSRLLYPGSRHSAFAALTPIENYLTARRIRIFVRSHRIDQSHSVRTGINHGLCHSRNILGIRRQFRNYQEIPLLENTADPPDILACHIRIRSNARAESRISMRT